MCLEGVDLKKKIIILLAFLLSLFSAFYFGVIRFSSVNLDNMKEKRETLSFAPNENMRFENWQTQDGKSYVSSTDDPIIWLDGEINSYANNIRFKGSLDVYENTAIKIFYTEQPGEDFSEEKTFYSIPMVKNDDVYFYIQKDVCKIRVDLYEQAGRTAKIQGFVINPRNLNINTEEAIVAFGIPFLVFSVIIILVFYRKMIVEHSAKAKKFKYLMGDLVTRDIKTKYRRSALGVLWSVLNPLLMMLVTTAVFANIFRFDIKDFPIYYLTGSLIFNFVSESTSFSLTSILGASGLIKKVYLPKYIFPLEKCVFSLVNMLFSFVAVVIVFFVLGSEVHLTMLMFPIPMLYAFVFSVGLSLTLSTLNVFFRDVGHLWSVFVTAWMYITPIIYPISILPGWVLTLVKLNPLYYYVEYFRSVFVYGTVPGLMENMVCLCCSGIMLLIGVNVFRKNQDKFILYI